MVNENVLVAGLVSLAELHKTHYLAFSAAINELAALRETVRGLDPTFSEVIEQKRKEQESLGREVVLRQVNLLDSLIRAMKNDVIR